MEIAYHIGVSCTDGEQIMRSLNRAIKPLAQRGTLLPPTGRYRKPLREAIEAQVAAPAPATARDTLMAHIFGTHPLPKRMVLSNPNFLANPMWAMEGGMLYGNAAFKTAAMQALFPDDTLIFHIGLRNPATLLPALREAAQVSDMDAYLGPADPFAMRWSNILENMRDAAPSARIVAWCNEDTPLIWHDILKSLGGDEDLHHVGRLDLAAQLMPREGLDRLSAYLTANPPPTAAQEHRVIGAFLSKFVPPEAVTQEIDVPGWDQATVARLTADYEADLQRIARIEGVSFIAP